MTSLPPRPGAAAEVYRAARNLITPHPPEAYPGLFAVRPGPQWSVSLIVPKDGQTVIACGGERVIGYVTAGGERAARFELRTGDRARLVASGFPGSLVEWEVVRAATQ